MAARSLLLRPNVAGLCLVGARLPVRPILLRMPSTVCPSFSAAKFSFSSLSFPIRRNFCIRATASSDNPASAASAMVESMERKIKEHLSANSVVVEDINGDGRHVSIEVISSAFEGKSAVNRQRMVYKAIWEELQDKVHAVDHMTTKTPSEAASGQ